MFKIFNWKNKSTYSVSQKDIEKVAKKSFNQFQTFLNSFTILFDNMKLEKKLEKKCKEYVNECADEIRKNYGISSNLKYSNKSLENDRFKILCIYWAGIEKLTRKKINLGEYILFKPPLGNLSDYLGVQITSDTLLLTALNIDPTLIPVTHKQKIMAIEEYNKATTLIMNILKILKDPIEFITYQEYYDYISDESKKIINKLQQKGFFNVQSLERFIVLCISYKMGLPIIDTLYICPDIIEYHNFSSSVPTENIKTMQERFFEDFLNKNRE